MPQDMEVRSAPTPFSPLLANVALHGMEDALGVVLNRHGIIRGDRAVVRYADDFVVFCESQEDTHQVLDILKNWLKVRGLTLSSEKTRIIHLTEGFDFLGFTVRQYPDRRTATGYRLLITPSAQSVQRLRERMRNEWKKMRGTNVQAVLTQLNPIIQGWANYFRIGVASRTFKGLDQFMFCRAYRYAKFTHPRKSWQWRQNRYWGKLNLKRYDRWVFGDKTTGRYLLKFAWFPIERHQQAKGASWQPGLPSAASRASTGVCLRTLSRRPLQRGRTPSRSYRAASTGWKQP